MAQGLTTATLRGEVQDASGEVLPGANVIAVHEPSGTEYGTSTRSDGTYVLRGMRVGGPYTVTASFVGYQAVRETEINLQLGEAQTLNFALQEASEELDEVRVIGERDRTISSDRTGARTNVSRVEVERTPSIQRSLSDFSRLSPQSTGSGLGLAGREARLSSITVDGATFNDVFGLGGTGGTPGGQAGTEPFSLDAIEEFNIDVAPYDVRYGNFVGGRINAVTRSGSNTFEGSAYYLGRNEQFVGGGPAGTDFPEFSEQFVGGRLGGPIIEDKLFFFVSGEYEEETSPTTTGLAGSGQANIFPIGSDRVSDIASIASNQYGMQPGGFDPFTGQEDNIKLLARLDWNINANNQLTLRNNYVDAARDRGVGRSTNTYSLDSQGYQQRHTQNTTTLELQSSIGANMYNELRLNYQRIRDEGDFGNFGQPQVDVQIFEDPNETDVNARTRTVRLGTERFRHANQLDQDVFELTNDFTIDLGSHELTFGTNNQLYSWKNLFIQDFFGTYTFAPIEFTETTQVGNRTFEAGDFIDGREAFALGLPSRYQYSYSRIPGNPRAEVNPSALQLGFYAQDEWRVTSDLRFRIGLRADVPIFDDKPFDNPQAEDAFGQNTSEVPTGNILWQPRLGFNWDATGDQTTQVRGGIGVFAGQPPFVMISNQYTNTGVDFARVDVRQTQSATNPAFDDQGIRMPDLDNLDDNFVQPGNPDFPEDLALPIAATSEINLTDPDFKYPSSLRLNLAVDQQLPLGLIGTVEGLYSSAINDIDYRNINLEVDDSVPTPIDGRPIYRRIDDGPNANFTDAILLTNTNEGYEYSFSVSLQRPLQGTGFGGQVAYTFSDAFNITDATSSRAISNYRFTASFDHNNRELGRSDFVNRHNVLANVSYAFDFDRYTTVLSAVYNGRSGSPFSYVYAGDIQNIGNSFGNLVYVPEQETDIFLESQNWQALNSFINRDDALSSQRGQIFDRNTAFTEWNHQLDLRFTQQFETFGDQRVEVSATVINFLNLINSDWGVRSTAFQGTDLMNFQGFITEDDIGDEVAGRTVQASDVGKYRVTFDSSNRTREDVLNVNDDLSRWQLQLGVRYTF